MIRSPYRIGAATIAVFITLGGLMASVHGLLYDSHPSFRYGIAALIVGIAGLVMMLNPSHDDHGTP